MFEKGVFQRLPCHPPISQGGAGRGLTGADTSDATPTGVYG